MQPCDVKSNFNKQLGVQRLRRQVFFMLLVFHVAVWLLYQFDLNTSDFLPRLNFSHIMPEDVFKGAHSQGFLVNTEGCRMQALDPFDSGVRKYFGAVDPPHCEKFNKNGRLVKADEYSIFIDWTIASQWMIDDEINFYCKYCEFWREELPIQPNGTYPWNVDTRSRFSNDCKKLTNRTIISEEEFIQVECFSGDKKIYKDFFCFPKNVNISNKKKNDGDLSVLIIGIDSLSRLNWLRMLPKSMNFIRTKLRTTEMLGYNKVGDNTFPNLVAAVSGLTPEELSNTCWPNSKTVFDDCPFIWKTYESAGFHTGFAEDSAQIGTFNYQKVGFRKQPTDFYGQIFDLVAENEIGSEQRLNTFICTGNQLTFNFLLQIAYNFAARLKDIRTWGFFWTNSLSHDYLTLPKYGDILFLEHLENLFSKGIFNDSVVIFMSDHGIRWGSFRETYQGYIEERLPTLFFSLPEWFENKYPAAVQNLKTNRRRLTSPFDLYETLLDLSDLRNLETNRIKERMSELSSNRPRGISLFLLIPESRTCSDAGISDTWCTCHKAKEVSTNSTVVKQVSTALVNHMNELLQAYSQCSKLKLFRIHSARVEEVSLGREEEQAEKSKLVDYFVMIETTPGHGKFEATMRFKGTNQIKVVDAVSRINTYGQQSRCISHYLLKLYCYCKT